MGLPEEVPILIEEDLIILCHYWENDKLFSRHITCEEFEDNRDKFGLQVGYRMNHWPKEHDICLKKFILPSPTVKFTEFNCNGNYNGSWEVYSDHYQVTENEVEFVRLCQR